MLVAPAKPAVDAVGMKELLVSYPLCFFRGWAKELNERSVDDIETYY